MTTELLDTEKELTRKKLYKTSFLFQFQFRGLKKFALRNERSKNF